MRECVDRGNMRSSLHDNSNIEEHYMYVAIFRGGEMRSESLSQQCDMR